MDEKTIMERVIRERGREERRQRNKERYIWGQKEGKEDT